LIVYYSVIRAQRHLVSYSEHVGGHLNTVYSRVSGLMWRKGMPDNKNTGTLIHCSKDVVPRRSSTSVVLRFWKGIFPGLCGYLEVRLGTLIISFDIKDGRTL
jgi:hypothetical protein